MKLNYNDLSFILRSSTRRRVFEALNKPITPTQLSKETQLNVGFVSNIIIGLLKRKLIECLTPNEKRYRLYKRTARGESILEYIKEKDL